MQINWISSAVTLSPKEWYAHNDSKEGLRVSFIVIIALPFSLSVSLSLFLLNCSYNTKFLHTLLSLFVCICVPVDVFHDILLKLPRLSLVSLSFVSLSVYYYIVVV